MKKIINYVFRFSTILLLCLGMTLNLLPSVYAAAKDDGSAKYTLQVYLNFELVSKEGSQLKFINTSGELETNSYETTHSLNYYGTFSSSNNNLPQNETSLNYYNVSLNEDGSLVTNKEFLPLFMDMQTTYKQIPSIEEMNPLQDEKSLNDYTLSQIWVYQPHKDDDKWEENKQYIDTMKLNNTDFVVYNVPKKEKTPYNLLEKMHFTDNANDKDLTIPGTEDTYYTNLDTYTTDNEGQKIVKPSTASDGSYTILIQKGTVIRLAFDTVEGVYEKEANFFDYDISEGQNYDTGTVGFPGRGINSHENYTDGVGTVKYAFGNANSGTGLGKTQYLAACQSRNDYLTLNSYNKCNSDGLTYGLVTGLKYGNGGLPVPIWNSKIKAPDIFSLSNVKGKTTYVKSNKPNSTYYNLLFQREGGTVTLSSVKQNTIGSDGKLTSKTAVEGLGKFKNTYIDKEGQAIGRTIYGNSFWPLDGAPSVGTEGHDPLFGDPENTINLNSDVITEYYSGYDPYIFPISDDSINHNSYFGMSYYIDFIVKPGYIAPLNYWFYGDDDMWIFLQKIDETGKPTSEAELIADIGGIHSSIGVYVNLWDWIKPITYYDESGKENSSQLYRLAVLYTERGASGSSAYMRFKLPVGFDSVDTTKWQNPDEPVDSPNTSTGANIAIICAIMVLSLGIIVTVKKKLF